MKRKEAKKDSQCTHGAIDAYKGIKTVWESKKSGGLLYHTVFYYRHFWARMAAAGQCLRRGAQESHFMGKHSCSAATA